MAIIMSGIIATTAYMNSAARRRREKCAHEARLNPHESDRKRPADSDNSSQETKKVLSEVPG